MSCLRDAFECFYDLFYRYFLSFLLVKEVGEKWSQFNNLIFFFFICVVLLYLAKPWGLTKWNRNVSANKRRLRALAFRRLGDELSKTNDARLLKRREISSLSFFDLQNRLQSGSVTAVEAVDAFRWKALECQNQYNCVIDFIKEAPDMAKALDEEYAKGTNRQKPPLFGMPFSVKENFKLVGYDCSRGLAKELEWPVKVECSMISHLRSLGAVPIVRTNIPQTMISFMCSNPTYGTTLNPYDVTRTPGGSSGGEACLISVGGCPFGTGSDIGGSLRIPAHFSGICSLKPTEGRFRVTNMHPGCPGIQKLALSFGYFAKEAKTLEYLFKLTWTTDYFARVPQCTPLPFRELDDGKRRLRIGYYVDDTNFPAVPACKRAVLKTKEYLESIGHELVPFNIPSSELAVSLICKLIFPDNAAYWLESLKYEDVDPYLKTTVNLVSIPRCIRSLASKLLRPLDAKASNVVNAYVRDLSDLRSTFEQADAYVKEFTDYWQELKLDAVIGLAFPFPAVQHEYPAKLSQAVFSTMLYNLVDFPAGIVRVDYVTKDDEDQMATYPDKETCDNWIQHPAHTMVRRAMINSRGLPVGVQVIALPYQEERCLQLMKVIEKGAASPVQAPLML